MLQNMWLSCVIIRQGLEVECKCIFLVIGLNVVMSSPEPIMSEFIQGEVVILYISLAFQNEIVIFFSCFEENWFSRFSPLGSREVLGLFGTDFGTLVFFTLFEGGSSQ